MKALLAASPREGSEMLEKPSFLGPTYGSAFEDPSVVASYHTRPPYPEEMFALVAGLLAERRGAVLDLGCGTGLIARRLVDLGERLDRVDALDVSPAMLAEAQRLPNGDHARIQWILGRAEDAPLQPPYVLVTAAASLHWMDWQTVLPRLHDVLTADGLLVILGDVNRPGPWNAELVPILQRYSANQEFQPGFDLVTGLRERGLFELHERRQTRPVRFRQSIEAYVESFHARSGFSRARMTPENVEEFDAAVRALVSRYVEATVELEVIADVAWGRPLGRVGSGQYVVGSRE